ncbi:nitrous oxide-stimulated promoter family protein [Psychromonas sp.]|uniref:nitrous oxide-stimulated promoter family protein n=1 Tax=Psychromonas sp. TaxID=1884585 RepID=UPI00356473A0
MDKAHYLPANLGLEFKTIKAMVNIYCKAHHSCKDQQPPCLKCAEFILYANEKLDRCPYGQNKPTCNKCPIHCYKKEQREQARAIMRYAGPRMLFKHPILAIKHLLAERRPVPTSVPDRASNRRSRKSQQ